MPLLQQYVPQVTFHKTRLGNESVYTCYYTFHIFNDDRIVITQHGYPLTVQIFCSARIIFVSRH